MERSNMRARLDDLRSRVLDDARQQARDIIQEAEAVAVDIQHDGEARATRIGEETVHLLEVTATNHLADKKRALSRDRDGVILARKQALLDRAIDEIKHQVAKEMRDARGRYRAGYLASLVADALHVTSFDAYELVLTREDGAWVQANPAFLNQFTRPVTLSSDVLPEGELGCIVKDAGGNMSMDNTISEAIRSSRERLKAVLSSTLFTWGDVP